MKTTAKAITRYPLLLDAVSIIFHNVMIGIKRGKPIHMGLGYASLMKCGRGVKDFSLRSIKDRLSAYGIIFSESNLSSSYVRLSHPKESDIFDEREFIYTCRSGYFHFRFDSDGTLYDIFSDFDKETPEFLFQLTRDFPGNNYLPDHQILKRISINGMIDPKSFLMGLNPYLPVTVEID